MATSTTTTSPILNEWCVSPGTEQKCKGNFAFTFSDIYNAFLCCKKNKSGKLSCLKYEQELEESLFILLKELNEDTYFISKSSVFLVSDPKPRQIWASDFKDRIVHHLLINYLEPFYEGENYFSFRDNVFSCRKNKGTHKAVEKVKILLNQRKYFIQLDLKSFFNSINREILYKILLNDLNFLNSNKKEKYIEIAKKIIFHKYTKNYIYLSKSFITIPKHKSLFYSEINNKGLPIGNLTSQFFANVYLNLLDRLILDKGFNDYVRYVDDFIIFGDNFDELIKLENEINDFLKVNLDIELNLEKTKIGDVKKGIDFLGYFIKPTHTLIRKRVKNNLLKKRFLLMDKHKIDYTTLELKKILSVFNSYYGHFNFANSYNFKNNFNYSLNGLFFLKNNKKSLKIYLKQNFKTMYEQIDYFKKLFNKSLIVFQVGNFYRLFDDQARFVSQKLGLKLVKRKNNVLCGFPLNSKRLEELKNLGYNYVIIKESGNKLISGIHERVLKEKNLYSLPFVDNVKDFEEKKETLNDILNWNLESMTPLEVYRRISYIIERDKK